MQLAVGIMFVFASDFPTDQGRKPSPFRRTVGTLCSVGSLFQILVVHLIPRTTTQPPMAACLGTARVTAANNVWGLVFIIHVT